MAAKVLIFFNEPAQASFSFIFGLFQTNQFEKFHSVNGARIWTQEIQNVSLFPKPRDRVDTALAPFGLL